ncbi:MAG: AbrB family transcriptional regulator [Gammaproteobacteria bacterium]|nr:AbrB family transcriptional regulator [Gammaproteobacteria bacterium]
MTAVTVSPTFLIVTPKEIRKSMGIVAAQKVHVTAYQGRIEMIPLQPIQSLRGFLKGIDTSVTRAGDRL